MGLLNRFKADTKDQTPTADDDADTREIRVTVFPTGGGRPYIRDVEVDQEGCFELEPGSNQTYRVARGSVWQEGTTERAILHEDATQTANPALLAGEEGQGITPTELHGVAKNNLFVQLDEASRSKGTWQKKSTWAMLGLALLFGILIFWQIKTLGEGFDQLAEAIRQMQMAADNAAGHQDISPE